MTRPPRAYNSLNSRTVASPIRFVTGHDFSRAVSTASLPGPQLIFGLLLILNLPERFVGRGFNRDINESSSGVLTREAVRHVRKLFHRSYAL